MSVVTGNGSGRRRRRGRGGNGKVEAWDLSESMGRKKKKSRDGGERKSGEGLAQWRRGAANGGVWSDEDRPAVSSKNGGAKRKGERTKKKKEKKKQKKKWGK
ncbi:hypothetical protein NL676_019158 [Syzygium grande]|nr:hypothetical protein NL676_019158 [Syzygium grande]